MKRFVLERNLSICFDLFSHFQPHRICISVPFYHCFGNVAGTLSGMVHGAANIVPCPSFNGAACVEAIEAERCTSIYGTPTMFVDILAAARDGKPDVSHVETGIMAGGSGLLCHRDTTETE